ncbi:MAG TPA: DUF2079 domain-containing protein [Patescibacteria group bacterium]|nr:DUF2079 domain-containing protein [Patescibacteria group bacterium]
MKKRFMALLPYGICLLFFITYSILAVIRHLHFGSFGFDLGIVDQIVWKYSQFQAPITTIQFYPFTSLLSDHVELIYVFLAPFYWIYSSPMTLLLLQTFVITSSGLVVHFLSKKYKVHTVLALSLLISYLTFYGIQNAIWFDVHSNVFGSAFLAWFIYFLATGRKKMAILAFVLTIICKEDMALLTLIVSGVFYLTTRKIMPLVFVIASLLYLGLIFFIYFPYFTQDGYRYANPNGLISDIQFSYLYDSSEKWDVYFYSFGWFLFLPFLSPIFLLPFLGDIIHYFVLGNSISGAQGLFMHYRASLAILLVWPFLMTVTKFQRLNSFVVGVLLLIVVSLLQYQLHVPLTYLSKAWFWQEPASVKDIRAVISYLPQDASVVAQNNIVPHIAQRNEIFTLWPEKKNGRPTFRWAGNPQYLVVDTAVTWDTRHLLTDRETFLKGIENLEKDKVIVKQRQQGSVILYTLRN